MYATSESASVCEVDMPKIKKTIATNTEDSTVTVSIHGYNRNVHNFEIALVPVYEEEDRVQFWIECVSKRAKPGEKYYFCPLTREVSWKYPEGHVEIIPYLIPVEEEEQKVSRYLRIYSPPSGKHRKRFVAQ